MSAKTGYKLPQSATNCHKLTESDKSQMSLLGKSGLEREFCRFAESFSRSTAGASLDRKKPPRNALT
jgi:hypothetical protein